MNRTIHDSYFIAVATAAYLWECPLCHKIVDINGLPFRVDMSPVDHHGYGRCVRASWAD